MMRLLIVNSSKAWCGVDQVSRAVTNGMTERGHEVLNAVRPESDYRRALDEAGLPWIAVPERRLPRIVPEWRRFLAEMRAFRPDVVHVHTGSDWGAALLLPRSAAPRVVVTRHNGYAIGRAKARLYRARFERFFAVSAFVARVLTEEDGIPAEQVRVLRNPLLLDHPAPRAEAGARFTDEVVRSKDPAVASPSGHAYIRTEPGDGRPFRVGFIGRYTRSKGIDVFFEVAERMAAEPGVRFYTVGRPGDAEDEAFMRTVERNAPNLVDLGFVTDTAGFYAFVDVTLMPSQLWWREAAGLTALEGQTVGTPVIACGSGALPEAVLHGRNGFVVEDNDPATFARHIRALRDDRELRVRMARAGMEHARTWDAEPVLDEHERAYLEVIGIHGHHSGGTAPSA